MGNPTIEQFKKDLGKEYSIKYIDSERCLFRDFGNGFDVEISQCNRTRYNQNKKAIIYLWYKERPKIVKVIQDVGRNASAINEAVEELHSFSKQLLLDAYRTVTKTRREEA